MIRLMGVVIVWTVRRFWGQMGIIGGWQRVFVPVRKHQQRGIYLWASAKTIVRKFDRKLQVMRKSAYVNSRI